MYKILKQILLAIIPQRILKKYDENFRNILALFYKGKKHKCNICEFEMTKFISIKNNDKLCPKCGSLSRTRRLYDILQKEFSNKKDITVLHFSPPKSIRKALKRNTNINYITSDFLGEFKSDVAYNIENIASKNNSFDYIICYHVLEHITNDTKAMSELYRVLKTNGICYIQTPFKEGEIYEDKTIIDEKERLLHFGQKDHVRIYSVTSLKQRLENQSFNVDVVKLLDTENNYNGYNKDETILIAKKLDNHR